MIQDRFYDQFRKGKDRKLTPEEVKEIDTRWQEAFPEEEPLAFDDINYIKYFNWNINYINCFRIKKDRLQIGQNGWSSILERHNILFIY